VVVEFTTGDVVSQSTAVANIDKLPHVTSVANPPVVEDAGRISRWKDSDHQRSRRSRTLLLGYDAAVLARKCRRPSGQSWAHVVYGGQFDTLTNPKASDIKSELLGFAPALVVLLVAFGSLAAAVTPLVSASLALLVGIGLLGIAAATLTFGTASPTLATMIGLSVGIDYSVFLITRHRQGFIDGAEPVDASPPRGPRRVFAAVAVAFLAAVVLATWFGLARRHGVRVDVALGALWVWALATCVNVWATLRNAGRPFR